jgi:ABC-type transport system involved in multi-copper enzyme maturation permease subunit
MIGPAGIHFVKWSMVWAPQNWYSGRSMITFTFDLLKYAHLSSVLLAVALAAAAVLIGIYFGLASSVLVLIGIIVFCLSLWPSAHRSNRIKIHIPEAYKHDIKGTD